MTAVVIPRAPSSSIKSPSSSDAADTAVGEAGSVMSIIWMPSSSKPAMRAYVLLSITAVAMAYAPSSSVKPFLPV